MIDTNQYLRGSSPYDQAYAVVYEEGDYSLETQPPLVPASTKDIQHTVKDGETLQSIAFRYYKDSGKWYLIAEANRIVNPLTDPKPGTLIRIPTYGS